MRIALSTNKTTLLSASRRMPLCALAELFKTYIRSSTADRDALRRPDGREKREIRSSAGVRHPEVALANVSIALPTLTFNHAIWTIGPDQE
jgi:hypothetical protein